MVADLCSIVWGFYMLSARDWYCDALFDSGHDSWTYSIRLSGPSFSLLLLCLQLCFFKVQEFCSVVISRFQSRNRHFQSPTVLQCNEWWTLNPSKFSVCSIKEREDSVASTESKLMRNISKLRKAMFQFASPK